MAVVDAAQARAELFGTIFKLRLTGSARYEGLAYLTLAQQMHAATPSASVDDIRGELAGFQEAVNTYRKSPQGRQLQRLNGQTELLLTWTGALGSFGGDPRVSALANGVAQTWKQLFGPEVTKTVAALDASQSRLIDRDLLNTWHSGYSSRVTSLVKDIIADPVMGQLFDESYGTALNLSWRDSAKSIIDNHPELGVGQQVGALLTATGELSASTEQILALQGVLKGQLKDVADSVDVAINDIHGINEKVNEVAGVVQSTDDKATMLLKGQSLLLDLARDEANSRLEKAEKEARDEAFRNAHAGAAMLGNIVGALTEDPRLGRQVSAVADFGIAVVQTVDTVLRSLAKEGGQLLMNVGSGLLTSGLAGAAVAVVSAFLDSGPSTDQLILDGLDRLQGQVERLGQEMSRQFEQVDKKLTEIYGRLSTALQQLSLEVRKVHADVQAVHESVVRLSFDVEGLKRQLVSALQSQNLADLRETLGGQVEWPYQDGPRPRDVYRQAESRLHEAAVELSAGELWLAQVPLGLDAGRLHSQLVGGGNEYYNLPVIISALSSQRVPVSCPRPVNIALWSLAAGGYADLELSDPETARIVKQDRHDQVAQAAQPVATLIQALAPSRTNYTPVFEWYKATTEIFQATLRDAAAEQARQLGWDPFAASMAASLPAGGIQALGHDRMETVRQRLPVPMICETDGRQLGVDVPFLLMGEPAPDGLIRPPALPDWCMWAVANGWCTLEATYRPWAKPSSDLTYDGDEVTPSYLIQPLVLGIRITIHARTDAGSAPVAMIDGPVWWHYRWGVDPGDVTKLPDPVVAADLVGTAWVGTPAVNGVSTLLDDVWFSPHDADPDQTPVDVTPAFDLVSTKWSELAKQRRTEYFHSRAEELQFNPGSPLAVRAREVTGVTLLLRSILSLTLPRSIAGDDALRAAFYGPGGLLHYSQAGMEDNVTPLLQAAAQLSWGDASLGEPLQERAQHAQDQLARYQQTRIDDQPYWEAPDDLDRTRAWLDMVNTSIR